MSAAKATGAAVKNAAIVTGDALVSAASTTYKAAKVASYAIGSGLKSAAKHTAYGLAALVIGSVVTPFDAARILFGALLDAKKLIGRDSELVDAVGELAEIATRNDSNEVQEKAANIKRTLNRSMIERTMDRIEGSYSKTFIKNLIGNGGNHVYAVNRAYEDLTSIFKKKSVDTDQQSNSSNDSGIVQNDDVFYDVDESHETL